MEALRWYCTFELQGIRSYESRESLQLLYLVSSNAFYSISDAAVEVLTHCVRGDGL